VDFTITYIKFNDKNDKNKIKMAKVRTEHLSIHNPHSGGDRSDSLVLKFNINVSVNGLFYTLLNNDDVVKIEATGVIFEFDKKGNSGYFCANNIDDLTYKIKSHCVDYFNRVIIEDVIVIKYSIETNCSYVLNEDGITCPNGTSKYVGTGESWSWESGTLKPSVTSKFPFGVKIYAKPFHKVVSKYNSGAIKSVYSGIEHNDNYYLNWLNDIIHISPPSNGINGEVIYSEENAKFFVDMLKWVCSTNENIKHMFSSPEKLLDTIQSRPNILSLR